MAERTEHTDEIFREIEDIYPLTPVQEGMLFHTVLEPGSQAYLSQYVISLRGRLDAAALRRAWERVVERRPVLRTGFAWEGMDRPLQLVRRSAPLRWEALDWRECPRAAQRERLEAYLEAQRERDFDLLRVPLMRLGLVQLADDRFELVWTYHHLLLDGWSLSLVLQDVFTAYEAILQGREPALPRRRPFRDHVARLLRQDLAAAEAFWRAALAGFTAPTPLGVDRAGESAPDGGAPFDRVEHRLSPQATSSLRSLARQSRVTLNTVVQGAWALLLSRYSGEDEVVFGVTASGRPPELQSVDEMVGLFINTLPLRLRVEPQAGVEEWLGRLQARQVESRAHEQAPLSRVHAWSGVLAGLPLFESILVFENHPVFIPVGGGEHGFEVEGWRELGRSHYPLALVVLPGEEMDLYLEYDRRRIGAGAAGRMVRHLETILEGVAVPGRRLAEVPLLTRAERARVLEEWNPVPAETPRACVHELFRAQAERTPEAAALVSAGGTLTFRELDRGSRRLAGRLRAHGVGPESVVAVLAEHSAEVVIALLAVLGAGGVYLPLDPGAPPERLAYVLGDARAALVLAQPGLEGRLPSGGPRVLPLDPSSRDDGSPPSPLPPLSFTEAAAYLVYTSGSTGLPKGVVVPHGAAAAHLGAVARAYGHTPADRVLAFASLTFDQWLEDVLAPLVAGASVVVRDPEVWTPAELAERVCALGVTAMNLPTAYWSQLVRDRAAVAGLKACLRLMIVGGEALQPATVRAWEEVPGGPVPLVNGYGPTEAVVTATLFEVPAGRAGAWAASVPIGRPVGGRTAYVLDASGEPAPVGVPGELCIGGAELARGYLGRPDLTAERFLPDAFGRVPGGRVYRTGDRARWLEAGELEFLGRVDQQVKVRGYRIEPGEVEAALLADGRVREAAVVAREDVPGERRLVAYAAAAEGAVLTGAELRAGLRGRLPEYMVPSAFVVLERLPLNASGKTDRRALPAPDAAGAGEYSEPRTGTERMLAGVWAEVLRVERVGTHDGFFALGGHSLLAMQVISRVRRAAGVEVPLRTLFEAPTLGALAARVDDLRAGDPEGTPPIGRTSGDGPFPLSFAQQRLWLVDRLEPGSAAYNMPHALRLRGALDADALRTSLGALVERHETLRTTFAEAGGEPVQVIHADASVALRTVDLRGLRDAGGEARRLAGEEALRPFDLARGPLLRSTLLRLGEEDHVLLFTLHHIVSDGWSMDVLVREVSVLYTAAARGGNAELPDLPVRYVDYAVWQRERLAGRVLEEQIGWWKARLAGVPPLLEVPTDRPRAAGTGARAGSIPFALPAELSEKLRMLSRSRGATLFMTVLAAWQLLLSRYSGQDDVVVGSPIAGRTRSETEGLIGFFVNTLVLRGDLAGDPSFRELLARVRETTLGAYQHQDLPFERLVEELAPERSLAHTPLFQVTFTLDEAAGAGEELRLADVRLEPLETGGEAAKFDLALGLVEAGDGLRGSLTYRAGLWDRSTVERMAEHLATLLGSLAADPGCRVGEVGMLTPVERAWVLEEWSGRGSPLPVRTTLHERFAAVACRHGHATAVTFEEEELSYAELERRANRLAHALRGMGVGPDVPVGVCLERSPEMLVAVLGILKAGGGYVPLDPSYPAERLAWLLEDSAVPVLVTRKRHLAALPPHCARTLSLDSPLPGDGDAPPAVPVQPENLAYVIYTSGSTGRPKGVQVTHAGVLRLFTATERWFGFGADDVWTLFHSYAFDFSVWEIWGALLYGGRLVVVPYLTSRSPDDFRALLADEGVTVLNQTPSAFRQLAAADREAEDDGLALRLVVFGGEALEPATLAPWTECRGYDRPRLVNMYGITETVVHVTYRPVARVDVEAGSASPIGVPIPDLRVYVLDRSGGPAPVGVPGEMYVGGAGPARGYLGRPDLTAERFIPDPYSGVAGARMYRSGDRARWLPAGELEYLGRLDAQVKVRGFRIEPGEIESVLERHPQVREAVVVARDDGPGQQRLVAYVVAEAGADLAGMGLREHLSARLPEYMVPAAFMVLEALPLNENGKVDRRALPAPEHGDGEIASVVPRTATEELLCGIWAEVLGLERVGVGEDFFALGGHSLLATRVISRARRMFGVELSLRALFEAPTVAELARRVDALQRAGAAPPIERVPREGPLPLSFAQQRLWLVDRIEPASSAYNMPYTLRLTGELDTGALRASLDELVRRHEPLRTLFEEHDGEPVQVVHPPTPAALLTVDLRCVSGAEEEVRRLAEAEASRPFHLARGPLLRSTLVRLGDEEHVLCFTLHHIVSDGWSMDVLVREVSALYAALSSGEEPTLPEPLIQYADYTVWQRGWLRGEALEAQLGYWRAHLAGAPPLLLVPTDHPRAPGQSARAGRHDFALPAGLSARLRGLSRREGTTLFMTLLAGWQALLARYAGQDDVVVGTPVAGRTRVELEGLIGFFVNLLPLRAGLDGEPTFAELLGEVREAVLGAYAHQDLPFERLVQAVAERSSTHAPIFQVIFTLDRAADGSRRLSLGAVETEPFGRWDGTTRFDLELTVTDGDGPLHGTMVYRAGLFEAGTIRRMCGHLEMLLEGVVADPARSPAEVSLLGEAERRRIVEEWNATERPFARDLCIHQAFEAQAARTPEAVALVFRGEEVTYAGLDRRAERLARALRRRGVVPEARVGVCVERSAGMVVALLGVLKAGGAYVPLDPTYPRERLAHMVRDSGLRVAVAGERQREVLPEGIEVVGVDGLPVGEEGAAGRGPAVTPDNLAYVIYTSGSTGTPKGVGVTHRNALSFFAAMDERVGGEAGTWLAVTSISFDISVLELLWTLARGFRVVVRAESAAGPARPRRSTRPVDFSLFYFASGEDAADGYRLLMEGAKFADRNGFAAVWTPERHFHAFGGLYPNPSVTGAAVAAVTERVGIRAGSVVLPLHSPVRVAEEWSVVDVLSRGRVGISFASGWHADDFVLAPGSYAERKEVMLRGIEEVRSLWRGDPVRLPGGTGAEVEVRTLPRPVQAELPVWITSAGSPETFETAGERGYNVLTHLLGQTVEELAGKVALYRDSLRRHGRDPESGRVALMLHTFVGESEEAVRGAVREPFKRYLASSVGLIRNFARSMGRTDADALAPDDMDALLEHAFERYFGSAGLMGTAEQCLETVERLREVGVDELACLVDFGVETEATLAALERLDEVRRRAAAPAPESEDEGTLAAQLLRHGATHLQCTPSTLRTVLPGEDAARALGGLRKLLLGGEALPAPLAAEALAAGVGELHNMYGPTETTVWSATHRIASAEGGISVGAPVANTRIHLVDPAMEPVPVGVRGELLIGGEGVARGYLGRPGLTAERFVPDPFAREPGARLYRTGDLARRRPDGLLEVLGRADAQVKVRGHRIEPGEVEAALEAHPAVAGAAVTAREDVPGERRLVGYLVAAPGMGAPSSAELRGWLRERLPEYMVPPAFVALDRLPLTPNGKLDVRALPAPELGGMERYVAPRTPVEEVLAGIWAEVLHLERVGVEEGFFDLGGHSLLATQVVSRARLAFGMELPLRTLFEASTVAGLAEHVEALLAEGEGTQAPPLVALPRDGSGLPLSFAQQRLWFIDQLEPGSAAYNAASALRLHGPLEVPVLRRSLDALVARHETLRTRFPQEDGRPHQLAEPAAPVPLCELDLRGVGADVGEEEALRLIREAADRPFDLAAGPLLRATLARMGEAEWVLVFVLHHIISDGWSMGVLVREVTALYAAYARGEEPEMPQLPVQYADYAAWQREWLSGETLEGQLAFWRERLRGAPPLLELPTDRPRTGATASRAGVRTMELPAAELRALSQRSGVTLFMTLLAAWQALLGRYSGEEDVVVGTPVAGRTRVEVEGLIGFFVNMLVLRTDLSGDPTGEGLLGRVREVALGAYAHQEVPFEKLVDELGVERSLAHAPLFQVLFALQNTKREALRLGDVELEQLELEAATVRFDLSLALSEGDGRIAGELTYRSDLWEAATIERMVGRYRLLLEAIAVHPERRLSEVALLDDAERRQLLREWNDTAREYPRACVHELFAEQAARTPHAPAVGGGDEVLGYAELERRANQLAHHLRGLGVGPEVRVGLLLERSPAMLVGILGVLKAGGAYVPLDPAYPAERLEHMLRDAGVPVLVTQSSLEGRRPAHAAAVVCLDLDAEVIARQSVEAPSSGVGPQNLAYVVYTSGSTGLPKGVQVEHRQLVNYVHGVARRLELEAGMRHAMVSTVAADLGNTVLYPALCTGGTLYVLSAESATSADCFAASMRRHEIDVLKIVPSHLAALLGDTSGTHALPRRLLVLGGEGSQTRWVQGLRERAPGMAVVNHYGPTETTVGVLTHRVGDEEGREGIVPLGRPLGNARVYVVDRSGSPVPVGVAGELWIGGAGMARGYLGRAGLTAERFVPDPFGGEPGARLYRTGDRVRRRAEGSLEFLGRVDQQVKLRGFRIEPGEVEAALREQEGVREALVVLREDVPGQKRLVAYVVGPAGGAAAAGGLREALRARLPEYMVPGAIVPLERLPVSPNGKVDRRALPAPEWGREEAAPVEPRTEAEAVLAGIWAEVLRRERVGVEENFFEAGGDSILSIQVVSRARRAGLQLSPRQLFEHPTIAALARVAGRVGAGAGPGAASAEVGGEVALTPIQHRFFAQELPERHHYNQSLLLQPRQALDGGVLRAALADLVRHHDALRLRYRWEAGGWRQRYAEGPQEVALGEVDLRGVAEAEQGRALSGAAERVQASLELERGPLLRAVHFRLGEGEERVLLVVHHLVVDGVSWRILVEDLESAYRQRVAGGAVELPEKTSAFQHWSERLVRYAGSEALREEAAYWEAALSGSGAGLPVDHPGGENRMESVRSVSVQLSEAETGALLREVPAAYGTQINDALLCALGRALGGWTGREQVWVELEGHGREELFEEVDLSRTVGWFTSPYPVRLEVGVGRGPGEALKGVKEQLRRVPMRGIGYGVLRYLGDAGVRERMAGLPWAEVVFNYLGQFDQTLGEGGLFGLGAGSVGPAQSGRGTREHLLELNGAVAGGRLWVQWSYSEAVHLRTTVEAVAERFGAELRGLIEHCRSEEAGGYTPSDFPLARVGQEELDRLLGRERGVEDLYPLSPLQEGMLFHTLYEPGSGAYISQTGFEIRGDLDVEAFRRAWEGALERHSALRVSFVWEKVERPLQVVRRRVALSLREEDWRGMDVEEQRARLETYLASDRARGLDLSRAPLMRLALFRTGERTHQLVWKHHHAILDGWSLPILFRDVLQLYEGAKRGETVTLAEARPYRDYVAWLERQDMAGAERFWREALAGFTTPTVLEPADPRAPGARGEDREYHLALSPEATRSLRELAQRERLTQNTVVQGAWALLLSRYTGEEDVLFGATVSGRPADLEGVEGMVGLFINTLPVRVRARPEARLVEWLKELQARQAELRDYEHTPLVQVQGWSEVPAGQPFFESILVFQNYPLDETLQQRGWELEIRTNTLVEEGNYHPLMLAVAPGTELSLKMEYDPERYGAAAIERLVGQLRVLLEGIAGDPDRRLADLPLLGKAERERVLTEWNGTAEYFPKACIHELITAQAARTPYAPAAVHEGEHLAYAELDRRSSQLANHLRGLGVGPEVRVALCLERGLATAVAILGVLKAGGAYVPLDPAYPAERLAYMLGDCDAPVLLTQERLRGLLPENSAEVVCLDTGWPGIARESSEPPRSGVGPQNLAYVIYTSGSTGRPKGVQIEHRALVQFASSMAGRLGLTPADRVLQFASPAFDVVVEELFPAWLSGAAVVFPGGDLLDPGQLLKVVERERVTAFELPTAYWHEWVYELVRSEGHLPGHVRFVIVGGERVVPERLAEWSRLGVPLVHVFGLTETAVTSTTLRLEAGDDGSRWPNLPVGTPIPNTRIYVLDTSLNPVPPGMAGELYVGGEGVARGYLGRPDLTAARFLPDSFAAEPGGRLYRTGDRVRWLADGNLEFLGRIDLQVKVRGHRIEPAEIEAVLARHPAVREAVVMVREDTSGDRRLVAYMVPARGFVPADDGVRVCMPESEVEHVTVADLYRFVERELPSYMVPTASVFLQNLPLTPNGKLDRRALPAPQWNEGEGSYVPPRTPVEEVLAGIWAEVLRTERVGVHDNFFALGGHSLLAMRVISQVRERLVAEVPIRMMFEGPTVAELAARVESYHMDLPVDAEGLEEQLAELEGLSEEELRLLLEQG